MTSLAERGNMPEILRIEEVLKKVPQVDAPVTHYQIDGVYVRSMFIPAGTVLTGAIHKTECISILAQGTIRIATEVDSVRVSAPHVSVSQAGVKRLGYTETDVTFITVHRTDGTSIEEIEKELVAQSFEEYEQFLMLPQKEVL